MQAGHNCRNPLINVEECQNSLYSVEIWQESGIQTKQSSGLIATYPVQLAATAATWGNGDRGDVGLEVTEYVLDDIFSPCHIIFMVWEIEFTDEFGGWWDGLTEAEQDSIDTSVALLEELGPALTRPHADTIRDSEFPNMRELRVQHEGRPYRILYAFDPRRTGILLIGGDKTGNDHWYKEFVPKADAIFAQHLREIEKK
jgi:hypothetical protein